MGWNGHLEERHLHGFSFDGKQSMIFLLKTLPSVALGCSRALEVLGGTESRNGSLVAVGINVNIYKNSRKPRNKIQIHE